MVYVYWCGLCKCRMDCVRTVDRRYKDAPKCSICGARMKLVIQPVAGVVKNPAVAKGNR